MHSHVSIVLNGENEYIIDVNRETCIYAHKTGIINISDTHVVHGIKEIKQSVTDCFWQVKSAKIELVKKQGIPIPLELGKMYFSTSGL